MNRELKFRTWGSLGMNAPFTLKEVSEFYPPQDGTRILEKKWEEGIIFMQYTGLKDKNGKEIYCGDIISFKVDFPEVEFDYGIVRFASGGFWTSQVDGDSEELLSEELNDLEGEVIGNIYEHKHLLDDLL